MVDVVTELAKEDALSDLLFVDDLVIISERITGLWNKFKKWKEAFESRRLKVSLAKTKVMVNVSIAMYALYNSNVDSCVVYSLGVKANSV